MAAEQLKVLVEQMPTPSSDGRYCSDFDRAAIKKAVDEAVEKAKQAGEHNINRRKIEQGLDRARFTTRPIDKAQIENAIAEIAKGGKECVLGLVEMLGEPGAEEDVKPHYALHSLGNYLLQIEDANALRDFAAVLAGELGGSRPKYVQAFLCQELQWFGHREVAPALGKLLNDEDLSAPASMALVAIRDGAAEQFRGALPAAKGRCKLNMVQGLGAVSDQQSIASLKALLADEDREVRLTAGWALARMGDAGSAALLIKAAGVEDGWERIEATKHCLVLAEKLTASGKKDEAAKIYKYLAESRKEPHEKYVRDVAQKALAAAK